MGLTRMDLENLKKVLTVGFIINISFDCMLHSFLIKSERREVTASNTSNNVEYELECLENNSICYKLYLNEYAVTSPCFILETGLDNYFFSLYKQEMNIETVINPRTDEVLWKNKQIDTVSYNKINNCPIYVNLDDSVLVENDRVNAHIFTPKIKGIYANENNHTLVIKWETDEVTKVTCDEEDTFDLETGLARAIAKYVLGNNYNAGTIFNKYLKSIKLTKKDCPVVELAKEKKTQKKTRLHS